MARKYEKLKAVSVTKLKKAGLHSDGAGLYLRIGPTGAKSWIFRYMKDGKSHDMGLGPLHTVSLAKARTFATEHRLLLRDGIDPIINRKGEISKEKLETAKAITFAQCAAEYIDSNGPQWKNPKHVNQWRNTLATYVYPVFGDRPVQQIDIELVLKVLRPIWQSKTETASRVRGRIENILDAARVQGYREGENPARLKGHLDKILPPKSKIQTVKHHPALPYVEILQFIHELRQQEGVGAQALYFTILTAARTQETIEATWDEIDGDIWTRPPEHMKGKEDEDGEHRVPLTKQARQIVNGLEQVNDYIFPGQKSNRGLSNAAMTTVLKRMGRSDLTVHGFRSTFKDWAAEETTFPNEVSELALAHKIDSKVEAAYRRGDLFEKRRKLMEAWSRYCHSKKAKVISSRT
jgi:integrase|tara:strand:+ start:168 stop:1388 length:1221 start_codon:yes stop_codon:yes gene_type:complete